MRVVRGICRFFTWLCMLLIVALMLLMVAEVLRRALFHRSILGSTEWAQVLLVCNMSAFGASILSDRQIKVNILTSHFKPKTQVILDVVVLILTFATVAVLSWQQFIYAIKSFNTNIFYININLPQWPFVVVFAAAYTIAAVTVLCILIRKIACIFTGQWETEARLNDLDEIFVFGKKKKQEQLARNPDAEQESEAGEAER